MKVFRICVSKYLEKLYQNICLKIKYESIYEYKNKICCTYADSVRRSPKSVVYAAMIFNTPSFVVLLHIPTNIETFSVSSTIAFFIRFVR